MNMVFDLAKARRTMQEEGIDCIITTSHDNTYYSTGSSILTRIHLRRLAAAFFPLDGDPVFGVHANEEMATRSTSWIKDIRTYAGGEWEPLKSIDFVADVLREKGLEQARIGMELLDFPSLCLDHLRRLLPSAEFVDIEHIFNKMRAVKSAEELELLSVGNMATAKAITIAFEMARPSDTEKEIARNIANLILQYGANRLSPQVWLAAGENIHETHHVPTDYRIKKGDLVHVDTGGFFRGYRSDISRTAVVGEPNDSQLKAYEIAVGAEWAAAEAMTPGATVMDVHNAVKRFYESKGYEYNKAVVGHSIGIACHEFPFLGPSHGDWVLEPGMFFEVEPSISIGKERVHTEDSFIVEKGPAKNVSEYRDISEIQVIR